MTVTIDPQIRDEEKLADLIRRRREVGDPQGQIAKALEREILELMYHHLYEVLRPMFLARYGTTVDETNGSSRWTAVLNEFFVGVLEKFPEGMLRCDAQKDVRNYMSRCMVNLLIDCHRKRKGRDRLLACLLQERERELHDECPDLEILDVLEQLQIWEDSQDPRQREWALILRYQYGAGASPEQIRTELGISRSEFFRRRKAALDALRRRFGE